MTQTRFVFLLYLIMSKKSKALWFYIPVESSVRNLTFCWQEGKSIYLVNKLSYQTSSLAKEITLSLDQRVQFERWALTSKLIISLQLVNAVAKRKEKTYTLYFHHNHLVRGLFINLIQIIAKNCLYYMQYVSAQIYS